MKQLYCAGKIGKRYQRQTVRLRRPLWKKVEFHQRAPRQSPTLACSRKRAIIVKFLFLKPYQLFQKQNFKLIALRCKQFFIAKQLAERTRSDLDMGTEMVFVWLQTPVSFPLSKETPTMKIYSGETVQVRRSCRPRPDLHRLSFLNDHTTYMQTSTVMNQPCVCVCI